MRSSRTSWWPKPGCRASAAWFVGQLDDIERQFVTPAAFHHRLVLIREIQGNVHRRPRKRCFPGNMAAQRGQPKPDKQAGAAGGQCPGQIQLFRP